MNDPQFCSARHGYADCVPVPAGIVDASQENHFVALAEIPYLAGRTPVHVPRAHMTSGPCGSVVTQ
jgi:hypothetical protein